MFVNNLSTDLGVQKHKEILTNDHQNDCSVESGITI